MSAPPPTAARSRVLHLLKTKGPQGAAALARRLGVTPTAVRQHLDGLCTEGLVAFEDVAGKVGRPRRIWRLAPAAEALFPDAHAELAVGMIEAVRGALGARGLDRTVRERTDRQIAAYRERVPGPDAPLDRRVAALARIRKEEGYMATWGRGPGDALHLEENHCPICAAARACVGLCAGEQRLFEEVLGPGVAVTREEWILEGARRCRYRIAAPSGAYTIGNARDGRRGRARGR